VRNKAAQTVGADRFVTIHLHASLEVCRQRDTAGHYAMADSGEIGNFPGVSSPYEEPESPDLRLDTETLSVDECVEKIYELLKAKGVFL
jgi:adenylylsulfate kinase-like enzyme